MSSIARRRKRKRECVVWEFYFMKEILELCLLFWARFVVREIRKKIHLKGKQPENFFKLGKRRVRCACVVLWEDIKLHINSNNLSFYFLTPNGASSVRVWYVVKYLQAIVVEENQWKCVKCLVIEVKYGTAVRIMDYEYQLFHPRH